MVDMSAGVLSHVHLSICISIWLRMATCDWCEPWQTVELDNSNEPFTNGSLLWNDVMFAPDQLAVTNESVRGCICQVKRCVPKCCPVDQWKTDFGCQPNPNTTDFLDLVEMHRFDTVTGRLNRSKLVDKHFYHLVRYPIKSKCEASGGHALQFADPGDAFLLLESGSVLVTTLGSPRDDVAHPCLEWDSSLDRVVAWACWLKTNQLRPAESLTTSVNAILMSISIPFLVVTFIVYAITSELNNIFGKSVLSQIACLIVSYLAVLANHIQPHALFHTLGKQTSCTVVGYIGHYAFIANFIWLTAMCFDIWLVFSGFSQSYRNLSKEDEMRRFVKYSCYAWGIPLAICIAIYLTDNQLHDKTSPSIECLMKWEHSWKLFYICPLLVTLLANVAMFSATAYNIYKHKRQNRKVLKADDNNCTNPVEKERLRLYMKLLVIMGVPWVCEPVSLVFNNQPSWLWSMFDWVNAMHGLTMFLIFVCNKRTVRAVNKSFCPSIHIFASERHTTMTSPNSSTSGNASFRNASNKAKVKHQSFEMQTPPNSTKMKF